MLFKIKRDMKKIEENTYLGHCELYFILLGACICKSWKCIVDQERDDVLQKNATTYYAHPQ